MNRRTMVLGAVAVLFLGVGCARQPDGASVSASTAGYHGDQTVTVPASASRPDVRDYMATANMPDVHFDFDKYDIRPDAARTLDASASWLKANAKVQVLVEGHCDERGTSEYNLALGERRAMAARTYLVSLGIPVDRLKTVSYGKEFPFDPTHNESGWSKNRRAHFVLTSR
jgi:peptidoglycan-associated lipoprotein